MAGENSHFVFPVQGASTLRQLNSMRLEGLLTDVIIVTGERGLKCHRAVLAASCPYFKAMFSHGLKECFDSSVTLHGVSHCAMELVLQYAYMGMCVITKKEAPDLLIASDLFGLIPLRDACSRFLQKCIDSQNCLQMCQLAEEHSCDNLQKASLNFARKHFSSVVYQNSFLELNVNQVTIYLDDDELQVGREDVVYDAAMRWIRHNESRKQYMKEILASVRLPFVKPEYLKLQAKVDPLIYDNKEFISQILSAHNFKIAGEFCHSFEEKQRKPRICASKKVLAIFGGVSKSGSVAYDVRDVIIYDPSSDKWGKLGSMPEELSFKAVASVSLEYEIVVTGGIRDNKAVNDVIIYHPYSNKWCPGNPLNQERYHHACVRVNNNIYVIGGTDGTACLDHVETSTTDLGSWRDLYSLPHAVKCPAVAAHRSKIYVFGGFLDHYAISPTIQVYSTVTGRWTSSSSSSVDYACAEAAVMSSKIYLLGGSSRNVKIYDPEFDLWTNASQLLQKRDNCRVTSVNEKLYVTGGLTESLGPSLSTAETFCSIKETWMPVKQLPFSIHRHESVCIRFPISEWIYPEYCSPKS